MRKSDPTLTWKAKSRTRHRRPQRRHRQVAKLTSRPTPTRPSLACQKSDPMSPTRCASRPRLAPGDPKVGPDVAKPICDIAKLLNPPHAQRSSDQTWHGESRTRCRRTDRRHRQVAKLTARTMPPPTFPAVPKVGPDVADPMCKSRPTLTWRAKSRTRHRRPQRRHRQVAKLTSRPTPTRPCLACRKSDPMSPTRCASRTRLWPGEPKVGPDVANPM